MTTGLSGVPDLPEPEDLRDGLARAVAVGLVLITLAAALVAIFAVTASRESNEASDRAEQLTIEAAAEAQRSQLEVLDDVDTFAILESQKRAAASVSAELLGTRDRTLRANALLEQRRWEQLAAATARLTTIGAEGPDGPAADPLFPASFQVRAGQRAIELEALRDAANEEAGGWGERESTYAAVLTLLAVSLYLLGFSLTLEGAARTLFVVLGGALGAVAVAAAGVSWLDEPASPPPSAAKAYAEGAVFLSTASTRAERVRARETLESVTEAWPTYARGQQRLADAAFAAGSPDGRALVDPESLETALAAAAAARRLGDDSADLLTNLGFYEFVLGVRQGDERLLEASVRHTRRSIERRADFVAYANLGVALLALDRKQDAFRAYEEGGPLLRGPDGISEDPVSGALTDLETLAAARPDLTEVIGATKEAIVRAVWQGRDTGGTELVAPAIEATLFPADAQIAGIRLEDGFRPTLDADGNLARNPDHLVMIWYRKDRLGWHAVSEISGEIYSQLDVDGYEGGDHLTPNSLVAGTYFVLRNASGGAGCLAGGDYRVELYANGGLAAAAKTQMEHQLVASNVIARNLDVRLCRPASWQPIRSSAPGVLEGHVAPDGRSGLYAFRFTPDFALTSLASDESVGRLMNSVVEMYAHLFPRPPEFLAEFDNDYSFSVGGIGKTVRQYQYGQDGLVRAGGFLTSDRNDGEIVLVFAFAPRGENGSKSAVATAWNSSTLIE